MISTEALQSGERKLLRFIAGYLDKEALKQAVNQAYDISVSDSLRHRSGRITVREGAVAYQLDFDLTVNLSILLSRSGELLAIRSPQLDSRAGESAGEKSKKDKGEGAMNPNDAHMASDIARMISEINEPGEEAEDKGQNPDDT